MTSHVVKKNSLHTGCKCERVTDVVVRIQIYRGRLDVGGSGDDEQMWRPTLGRYVRGGASTVSVALTVSKTNTSSTVVIEVQRILYNYLEV